MIKHINKKEENNMKLKERYELPYEEQDSVCDKRFFTGNGQEEFCHFTGFCVLEEDGSCWFEFESSDGELYYGR